MYRVMRLTGEVTVRATLVSTCMQIIARAHAVSLSLPPFLPLSVSLAYGQCLPSPSHRLLRNASPVIPGT